MKKKEEERLLMTTVTRHSDNCSHRMAYYTEQELKMQIKGLGVELVTFINEKKYDTQGTVKDETDRARGVHRTLLTDLFL